LRTFHQGGFAGNVSEQSNITAKFDGIIQIDDLRTVKDEENNVDIVISRASELKITGEKSAKILSTHQLPYGSKLYKKQGVKVLKGEVIAEWDPWNSVIISEFGGIVQYENIIQGETYQIEKDEQTNREEFVIKESKNKKIIPTLKIVNNKGEVLRSYNLPFGARIAVKDKEKIKQGTVLVKIPRKSIKAGDITGGLPRVTELFEARNPSNPAVVSEIDGIVSFGKIKRGNREIVLWKTRISQPRENT